ncbi:MAG: hypothetical protein FJZ92_03690 [Chloroflexi bacterium]|nr:hypothetical protein [Chloroflexota bacterium]
MPFTDFFGARVSPPPPGGAVPVPDVVALSLGLPAGARIVDLGAAGGGGAAALAIAAASPDGPMAVDPMASAFVGGTDGSGTARAVTTASRVRVIVPAGFQFTPGWDAPIAGTIFDLDNLPTGLVPAPVGFKLPPGAPVPPIDFFVPESLIAASRFAGAVNPTGVSLVSFNGGTIDQLSSAVAAVKARSATVFVAGTPITLIPGAPSFVNAAFRAQFPDRIPERTLLALVAIE